MSDYAGLRKEEEEFEKKGKSEVRKVAKKIVAWKDVEIQKAVLGVLTELKEKKTFASKYNGEYVLTKHIDTLIHQWEKGE